VKFIHGSGLQVFPDWTWLNGIPERIWGVCLINCLNCRLLILELLLHGSILSLFSCFGGFLLSGVVPKECFLLGCEDGGCEDWSRADQNWLI